MKDIQNQPSITSTFTLSVSEVKKRYPGARIQVAPGIFQTIEDYEANMQTDAKRDDSVSADREILPPEY